MIDEDKITEHPSFGMIAFYRTHGGVSNLFGSSIPHSTTIRMKLKHGVLKRGLNHDWYFGRDVIAEVELSPVQFAELLTNMNGGDGVPCTIKWLKNEGRMPDCPFVDKLDQYNEEFNNQIKNITSKISNLGAKAKEYLEKKDLKVGEKKELLGIINNLLMEIKSNIPFIHDSFNETMSKTIVTAKAEIEAQVQSVITKYGIEKLEELHGNKNKEIKE